MVRVLILAFAFLLIAVPTAQAQIFWELTGATQGNIGGTSTFSGEEGRIEVSNLSFGISSSASAPGQAASIYVSSVSLSKQWDPSSVNLAAALSTREPFTRCFIRVYAPGGAATVLDSDGVERRMPMGYEMQIELINARLEFFAASGTVEDTAENVGIVFDEIRIEHGSSLNQFIWSRARARAVPSAFAADGPAYGKSSNPFEFELPASGALSVAQAVPGVAHA